MAAKGKVAKEVPKWRISQLRNDALANVYRTEVAERCTHDQTRRVRCTAGTGMQIRDQCEKCGDVVGNVIKRQTISEAELSTLPIIESAQDVRHRLWTQEQSKRAARIEVEFHRLLTLEQAIYDEWWEWYNSYLRSPSWAKKRMLVFERANRLCEGCRKSPPAQVHHLSYEHVGSEFLWELAAICEECHHRVHESQEKESANGHHTND